MKVGILGTGTAGIQTMAYFMSVMPDDVEIYSIYDPKHPILGIGESTTTFLPQVLWQGLGLTMLDNIENLDATSKHGVLYKNWREDDFYTSILPPFHGMHFNNFRLPEVAIAAAKTKHGYDTIEGEVTDISQTEDRVYVTIDGVVNEFHYIVDCRGYPTDYTDYEICDYLPVNHCLVHTVDKPGDWNFTYHQATKNGWMFGIPLRTRQGWGYLYNDTITTKDEALQDIAEIFQEEPNTREFAFKNYYAKNIFNGRIIKNGNRALFFEPLEALSGTFYEAVAVETAKVILDNKDPNDSNSMLRDIAETYAAFICMVYHGGSTFDTPFWKETKIKTSIALQNSDTWNELYTRINTLTAVGLDDESMVINPISIFLWKLIDERLGYGYFK
jgi:hypothetical protein